MVSPKSGFPILTKYSSIPSHVGKLDPSSIGNIFKNSGEPHYFFPSIGLFSAEFSLGYCNNMHFKKSESTQIAGKKPKHKN
jgi:hypothetical protein